MSTKFFTNSTGNTLFDKFKGIAADMINFDSFLAVVGFFRSSGYFKLRKELGNVSEIKILVGINIDDIFRKHNINPEKPDVPLNKNDAFQKVQKRHVQEKR